MWTRARRAFPALTNVTHDYAKQDVAIAARPYVPAIKLQDRRKKKKHGSLAGVMKRVQCGGGNLELCFLRSGAVYGNDGQGAYGDASGRSAAVI